jgi:DNA primase
LHIKELAEYIGIEEPAIIDKIQQALDRRAKQTLRATEAGRPMASGNIPDPHGSRPIQTARLTSNTERLESKIIAMMLQFPEIIGDIINNDVLAYFLDDALKLIGNTILSYTNFTNADITDLINKMPDTTSKSMVAALSIQDDSWDFEGCRRLIAQFVSSRSRSQNGLLRKIREAEESNNYELLSELLKKKQNQARSRQGSNLTSAGG